MATHNASTPGHIYGFVRKEILRGLESGFGEYEECVIFGVTSEPSRCLHFSILCESGAQWARIPIHMVCHERPTKPPRPLPELQCWDCYGWEFSVTAYEYLHEMGCKYRTPAGEAVPASYWFTLDHMGNGFSDYPPQHKCYHFLCLEDGTGQIAAMPNNRILWCDDSFTVAGKPIDYKTMAPTTFHCEEGRQNPQATAFTRDD